MYINRQLYIGIDLTLLKCQGLFRSGQRMLENFQNHLDKEVNKREDLADKLSRQSHILFDVKSGVEHLADKLNHLKAVSVLRDKYNYII